MKEPSRRLMKAVDGPQIKEKLQAEDRIDDVPEYNEYFLNVSIRFRYAKIICVFLLCIFVLSSMFVFGDTLTYENARYILRDLGQILSDDTSVPAQRISFDSAEDADYTMYRGSIAVCGISGVRIYSPSGTLKLKDSTSFTSPVAVSSEKYCIVYSLGAYNLSIYNTVARVYDMKFDYPIYDVDVSNDGHVAVMTQSKEYKCVVYSYDPDFRLLATYNKSSYPVAVDLSDISGALYISTFNTENGKFVTELDCYEKKSDTPLWTKRFNDTMAYDIGSAGDSISVVSGKGIVNVDKDGTVTGESLSDEPVRGYVFCDEGITLLRQNDNTLKLEAYGYDGKLKSTFDADGAVGAYLFDDLRLLLKKNKLTVVSESGTSAEYDIGFGVKKILYNDGYAFVCYSDFITPIKIS